MRKRFEQQYSFGVKKIEETKISLKSRDAFGKLCLALLEIYKNPKYNTQIFNILEKGIVSDKKQTGRPGMNLWQIFVLGQTRLALNISYDRLEHMANYDSMLRQLLGIEAAAGFDKIELEYQNIVDNVKLLTDEMLVEINQVIVKMGQDVFKKKEEEALCLKTDSYVLESNVHYPTDYNLLWDSARKTIDCIKKISKKHEIKGWRKIRNWYRELKNIMREVSLSSKKSKENRKLIVEKYLEKARLFLQKVQNTDFPIETESDLSILLSMEYYVSMLIKHIDLLERRVIKGEKIPHSEKIFSIFEPYTEWITKGKQNPKFELGKVLTITTDQSNLIIDYQILENQSDKQIVEQLAQRVLNQYHQIKSWSFDKGYYTKENKELLSLFIDNLVMPKKGKLNKEEYDQEHQKEYKKLRNKHSAVESNINELEHRGLDRCPDRSYEGFKRYVGIGICAYNLHRIGAELQRQAKELLNIKQAA